MWQLNCHNSGGEVRPVEGNSGSSRGCAKSEVDFARVRGWRGRFRAGARKVGEKTRGGGDFALENAQAREK